MFCKKSYSTLLLGEDFEEHFCLHTVYIKDPDCDIILKKKFFVWDDQVQIRGKDIILNSDIVIGFNEIIF